MYSKEFKELVEKGVKEQFYIGIGNPNAKILFVGKEAAIDEFLDKNEIIDYSLNAKKWQVKINNNESEILSYSTSKNEKIRKSGHTWRKYQTLQNFIFLKEKELDLRIDFLENVFTSEMSDKPSKRTKTAQNKIYFKEELEKRKKSFFTSDFIQQFPVIILACSEYIWNKDEGDSRQIDNIFFNNNKPTYEKVEVSEKQNFWIHLNSNRTKLVIHTRQLSTNVMNNLLEEMGKVIRKFMIENGYIKE